MDEKRREIEEIGKWPVLFPLDKTKGELADIVIKANKDIQYLLSRIKELEEGIEKIIPLLHEIQGSHKGSIGSFNNVYLPQLRRDGVDQLAEELYKLIGKEKP